MGQTWIDTAVEGARELVGRDLAAAHRRTLELVRDAPHPSGKLLAETLLIHVLAQQGRIEAALCLYLERREEARRRRLSPTVRTELELRGAQVYFLAQRWSESADAITAAHQLLGPELERAASNRSPGGQRKLRRLRRLEASAWVLSGWLALRDDPRRAYRHAEAAARLSSAESVQIAALAVLANAAVKLERGTLAAVLELIQSAETKLRKRRRASRLRIQELRWTRARALVHAGLPDLAEEVMVPVVEWFEASLHQEDAKRARQDLEWIRQALAEAESRRRRAALR